MFINHYVSSTHSCNKRLNVYKPSKHCTGRKHEKERTKREAGYIYPDHKVSPRRKASGNSKDANPNLTCEAPLLVLEVDDGVLAEAVPVPLRLMARFWKAWKLRALDSSELIALEEEKP